MNKRFTFTETRLSGLYEIERKPIEDDRGFFSRFFCAKEFAEIGFTKSIAQINQTLTKEKGSIRGMHFQFPPSTETKIVSCINGEILDVAVDLRMGSPTFLQWHSVLLNAKTNNALLIPDGFAHGFQTLTDNCNLVYLHTSFFEAGAEGALNAFDPVINIEWALPVTGISERDLKHPMIDNKFKGINII